MLLSQVIMSLHVIHHSELNCIRGRKQADCGACRLPPICVEDTCRYHFMMGITLRASQTHEVRTMLVTQVAHALGAMVASPLRGELATFP